MGQVRRSTTVVLALLLAVLLELPHASAAAARSYALYETQGSRVEPVRWNPCQPIRYRVNANGVADAAAVRRVRGAVAEAARATGMTFTYVGTTSYVPDSRTNPVPGGVKADVVITWARAGKGARRSAMLPSVARLGGIGGYAAKRTNGGLRVARTGFVVFNAGHVFSMSARKQYLVALHELGHLVGLDDVSDRRQVMNRVAIDNGPSHYAAGDRAGLRRLGRRAGCLAPAPAPRTPTVARSGTAIKVVAPVVSSVSGPVTYTLSSPDLGGTVAESAKPTFAVSLPSLVRNGHAGKGIGFTIRAANRVGASVSRSARYAVPPAELTRSPSLSVTPAGVDVIAPRAVIAGTGIDVTDQLLVSTSGSITAVKVRGTPTRTALYEHNAFFGSPITRYDVSGTVTVTGPGLEETFDVTGTYLVGGAD